MLHRNRHTKSKRTWQGNHEASLAEMLVLSFLVLMKLISRTYVLGVLTSTPQAAQRSWESRTQPGSSLSRQGFQKFSRAASPTAQMVNPVLSAMARSCSCSLIPGMQLWNTVEDSSSQVMTQILQPSLLSLPLAPANCPSYTLLYWYFCFQN